MNKRLGFLLLAAACEPSPPLAPTRQVVRQALVMPPPGGALLAEQQGAVGDLFGHALAWGDFDGDGHADLAVGAPGASSACGRVVVFFGPMTNGGASRSTTIDCPAQAANAKFGAVLAAGDFDVDAIDDLVVGAPYMLTSGRVYVFRGRPLSGPLTQPTDTLDGQFGTSVPAAFGAALAMVRPNKLWVGAPGARDGGAAELFTTSGASMIGVNTTVHAQQPDDGLGASIAALDFTGDGRTDVLIGGPSANGYLGSVEASIQSTGGTFNPAQRTPGTVANEQFGTVLAALDTGLVAIASPHAGASSAGRFYLAKPSSNGSLDMLSPISGNFGDELGTSIATSDSNGDHVLELYVGAPGNATVNSFSLGLPPVPGATLSLGVLALGTRFGSAIVGGADLLGDPALDLAIGAEAFIDATAGIAGGAVFVYPGSPTDGGGATGGADAGAGADGGVRAGDGGTIDSDGGVPQNDAGLSQSDGGLQILVTGILGTSAKLQIISPSRPSATWEWDFGDMSQVESVSSATAMLHDYHVPGGYRVHLTLLTLTRQKLAEADVQVKIPDPFGDIPPSAKIFAIVKPDSAGYDVAAQCVTDDPTAQVRWDFADPAGLMEGAQIDRTFPGAAVRAHCYVSAPNGLWAHDSMMLGPNDAASCRMMFDPPSGAAPLDAGHFIETSSVLALTQVIIGEDGKSLSPGASVVYPEGFHPVRTETHQLDGTVRCVDRARLFAYPTPTFNSVPPELHCGQALSYVVDASGGEVRLSSASDGVTFDPTTHTVRSAQVVMTTSVSYVLKASNPFTETVQTSTQTVVCDSELDFRTPCGCGSPVGVPVLVGLMALLRRAGRRRQR
jgi:hypothetical protein